MTTIAATELVDFNATKRRIAEAKTVEEVQVIRSKMEALVAYYKAQRDPEKARKAAEAKLFSEARIGEMLMTLKSSPGTRTDLSGGARQVPGKIEIMKAAGISTEQGSQFERLAKLPKEDLAKVAHEGKSARSILRPKSSGGPRLQEAKDKIFAYEAVEGKLPPADRHFQMEGVTPSTYDRAIREVRGARALVNDELAAANARIAELETENARLKRDLEAIQTGQLMRMSQAAMEQRRVLAAKLKNKREARGVVEAVEDKTKEDYERQIRRLKTQVNTEKAKAASMALQRTVVSTISNEDRKFLLVLTHPDGATDPIEKAKRERAFKLINAIPELVEE
jgi:hypothetical protein